MESGSWSVALKNRQYLKTQFVSWAFLAAVLTGLSFVLVYAEDSAGFTIEQRWLYWLPPADLSVFIFYTTYGFAFFGLFLAFRNPGTALRLVQAYALLSLFRTITLLVVPLAAHPEMIPLDDWLLRSTVYAGRANLQDLFFSGHTATLVLFALLIPGKYFKIGFVMAAVAVGLMLITQRVHYITDVVVAPVFATLSWWLTRQPVILLR